MFYAEPPKPQECNYDQHECGHRDPALSQSIRAGVSARVFWIIENLEVVATFLRRVRPIRPLEGLAIG